MKVPQRSVKMKNFSLFVWDRDGNCKSEIDKRKPQSLKLLGEILAFFKKINQPTCFLTKR